MSFRVPIWEYGEASRITINSDGVIDDRAKVAFTQGQCHALALAIREYTNWPLVALCKIGLEQGIPRYERQEPTHILCRDPKGKYIDIYGFNDPIEAWGEDFFLDDTSVDAIRHFISYHRPRLDTGRVYARTLLKSVGINY